MPTDRLFDTITVLLALVVPTGTVPKLRLAGENETPTDPVPLKETSWTTLVPESVTLMLPKVGP